LRVVGREGERGFENTGFHLSKCSKSKERNAPSKGKKDDPSLWPEGRGVLECRRYSFVPLERPMGEGAEKKEAVSA